MNAVFPLYLLPSVKYFSFIKANDGKFYLEQFENFEKQTPRTRFQILSSQGVQTLSVPIFHHSKGLIKEVQISYESDWQKQHWASLKTCYRKSPFFEFYTDGLNAIYDKRYKFLFDFNLALLHWAFDALRWEKGRILCTSAWENKNDIVNLDVVTCKPYYQTFQDRLPFQEDLSIVDLLFNTGSDANSYL